MVSLHDRIQQAIFEQCRAKRRVVEVRLSAAGRTAFYKEAMRAPMRAKDKVAGVPIGDELPGGAGLFSIIHSGPADTTEEFHE